MNNKAIKGNKLLDTWDYVLIARKVWKMKRELKIFPDVYKICFF